MIIKRPDKYFVFVYFKRALFEKERTTRVQILDVIERSHAGRERTSKHAKVDAFARFQNQFRL
jgi:hypothetical protein